MTIHTTFKKICDDLALVGTPLSDQDKVFHLLHGLGPDHIFMLTEHPELKIANNKILSSLSSLVLPLHLKVVAFLLTHRQLQDLLSHQITTLKIFVKYAMVRTMMHFHASIDTIMPTNQP